MSGLIGRRGSRVIKRYPDVPVVAHLTLLTTSPPPNFEPNQTTTLQVLVESSEIPIAGDPAQLRRGLGGRTVTFTSLNSAIASVPSSAVSDVNGVASITVTAVGAGTTTIEPRCEGVKEETFAVTVTNPQSAVDHVDIVEGTGTINLSLGGITTRQARPKDVSNNVLVGKTVAWSSSDGTKTSVTADSGGENHQTTITGLATGGSPTVKATCDTIDSTAIPVSITAETLWFAWRGSSGSRSGVQGGGSWNTITNGVLVSALGTGGAPAELFSGDGYALEFPFDSAHPNREQRGYIGGNVTELWLGFYWWLPSNFKHRDGPSSDNNKFLKIWSGDEADGNGGYSSYSISSGPSTYPVYNAAEDSRFIPESGNSGTDCTSSTATGGGVGEWGRGPTANCLNDSVRGTWIKIEFHTKIGSAPSVADGIQQLWLNGTQLYNYTNDSHLYPRCPSGPRSTAYFKRFYMMGAANTGYIDPAGTRFFINRVRYASSRSLADPDNTTGW